MGELEITMWWRTNQIYHLLRPLLMMMMMMMMKREGAQAILDSSQVLIMVMVLIWALFHHCLDWQC